MFLKIFISYPLLHSTGSLKQRKLFFLNPLEKGDTFSGSELCPLSRDLFKKVGFCCQNHKFPGIWGQSHTQSCGECEGPLRRSTVEVVQEENNSAQQRDS